MFTVAQEVSDLGDKFGIKIMHLLYISLPTVVHRAKRFAKSIYTTYIFLVTQDCLYLQKGTYVYPYISVYHRFRDLI